MAYITRIQIEQCRNVRRLDVDLSVPPAAEESGASGPESVERPKFRHMILTGPNGSGKSGVLEEVAKHISGILSQIMHSVTSTVMTSWSTHAAYSTDAEPASQFALGTLNAWMAEGRNLSRMAATGELVLVYLPARRQTGQQAVVGPAKLDLAPGPATQVSHYLLQLLVNKKTEAAFAGVDRDHATVARIDAWFAKFDRSLRLLMEDDGLTIEFDRAAFNFVFHSDGYVFDLHTLADGHAAFLMVIAELLIRIEAVQRARGDFTFEPEGIVIIDEIETHLHLSLQEQILPFLVELFPRFQFIVATHSPAVIASIPNAVVCDLRTRTQTLSDHFRGVRYGKLMTEHFGISSEIDLDSTEKLLRLRELAGRAARTPAEEQDLADLTALLTARSPSLAVEVWMAKERLSYESPVARVDQR
jgi:hypothetical protein